MNKKTKSGIILTSLAAIAFAGSLLAGSTYALFTSESKNNIVVQSGKVDVQATIDELSIYSPTSISSTNYEIVDDTNAADKENNTFKNGGTASFADNKLTLKNVTPGDKVTFKIKVHNDSTVKSMYRTVVSGKEDDVLFNGLIVKINDDEILGNEYKTDYKDLDVGSPDTTIDVSVELPTDATNVYQDKKCEISFTVEAIQGNAYKGNTYNVTTDTIQDYLDGQYGSIDNCTLVLATGQYDKLELGRATSYPGSNTDYYAGSFDAENKKTLEEIQTIATNNSAHRYYVRNLNNVTLKAATGATVKVAGMSAVSGTISNKKDYVINADSSTYFLAENWSNISFEGITFTSGVNIESSSEATKIDGVYFKNCTFDTNISDVYNSTEKDVSGADIYNKTEYYGIRYYNELNNEAIKNLVVSDCKFKYLFTAIYGMQIKGMTVINSSFEYIKFNAIQSTCIWSDTTKVKNKNNQGLMKIKNNTFTHGKDRVIRLGYVLGNTHYIIKGNKASDFYDNKDKADQDHEVMKATELADGIVYDIANNDWGDGTSVHNEQLKDI